ncbi:hypothetical protein BMF94_2576 [Rhodotorula taiwanensis]|uniref:DOPA 4,5-dioxygenase n=1 Tax=Rhodotorula taiwanensis TaxID=741276 RepID=A0A2S5BC96_9BASI|nr:hypothetical protein BMF94_2576 [Rhodotorula taiwanensis]
MATYRDPLATLPTAAAQTPLSEDRQADGKSLVNPPRSDDRFSEWYESYPEEFEQENNAFDFHIYYASSAQTDHARKLHERIRREFPELRVYRFWDKPVGPHPVPMFEVNTFTPAQFGALFGFLVAYRGDLSIHPNTTSTELLDHTVRATWMGQPYPLVTDVLREHEARFP